MKKIVMMLVVGAVVFWGLPEQAKGFDVFPICTASGDQTRPDVSGDNVVWIDHRTTDYNVRFKNLSTGNETLISTSQSHSTWRPSISGNTVVWMDNRSGVEHWYDIYGYDISTSTEFLVSPQGEYRADPDISGDIVVYYENAAGHDNYDIYGYDLSTGTRFPVCTDTHTQFNPATNGNTVVWTDFRQGACIYGYDIASQSEFSISTTGSSSGADISGNIVVWADSHNDTNGDIYGYDLNTHSEFAICEDSAWQTNPAISGNYVVWADNRNGGWEIFGYDLLAHTEFALGTGIDPTTYISISGNLVVWESNGDIYGATIPEPCSLLLIGLGGLLLRKRK